MAEQTPEALQEYAVSLYSLLFELSRSYQNRLLEKPSALTEEIQAAIEQTPKLFGVTAGFASRDIQTTGGVWRIDMTKCPYHDTCVEHGCPELCPCFCDSDDIAYDKLHPKLVWHRTKTLGRGGDCCDFCLKLAGK